MSAFKEAEYAARDKDEVAEMPNLNSTMVADTHTHKHMHCVHGARAISRFSKLQTAKKVRRPISCLQTLLGKIDSCACRNAGIHMANMADN